MAGHFLKVKEYSTIHEWNVGVDFSGKSFGQKAELKLDRPAVTDLIIKNRMDDRRAEALFIIFKKDSSPGRCQVDGITGSDKMILSENSIGEKGEDYGIGDHRSALLHQVESKSRSAKAGLMVKSDIRIEADGVGGDRAIPCKEAVAERKQGIYGIFRRTPVSSGEIETEHHLIGLRFSRFFAYFDHPGKILEVG